MRKLVKTSVFVAIVLSLALVQSMSAQAAAYTVIGSGSITGEITALDATNQTITVNGTITAGDTTTTGTETVSCIPFDYLVNHNVVPAEGDEVTIGYQIRECLKSGTTLVATSYEDIDAGITYNFLRPKK